MPFPLEIATDPVWSRMKYSRYIPLSNSPDDTKISQFTKISQEILFCDLSIKTIDYIVVETLRVCAHQLWKPKQVSRTLLPQKDYLQSKNLTCGEEHYKKICLLSRIIRNRQRPDKSKPQVLGHFPLTNLVDESKNLTNGIKSHTNIYFL